MKTTFPLATYSASDYSERELMGSCRGAVGEERECARNILLRDFRWQDKAPGPRTHPTGGPS